MSFPSLRSNLFSSLSFWAQRATFQWLNTDPENTILGFSWQLTITKNTIIVIIIRTGSPVSWWAFTPPAPSTWIAPWDCLSPGLSKPHIWETTNLVFGKVYFQSGDCKFGTLEVDFEFGIASANAWIKLIFGMENVVFVVIWKKGCRLPLENLLLKYEEKKCHLRWM